jgi:hypothetical protein
MYTLFDPHLTLKPRSVLFRRMSPYGSPHRAMIHIFPYCLIILDKISQLAIIEVQK